MCIMSIPEKMHLSNVPILIIRLLDLLGMDWRYFAQIHTDNTYPIKRKYFIKYRIVLYKANNIIEQL